MDVPKYVEEKELAALAKQLRIAAISPNPTADGLNVDYTVAKGGKVTITLTDIVGRVVKTEVFSSVEGLNAQRLNISSLPNGNYILRISDNDNSVAQSIVKQ